MPNMCEFLLFHIFLFYLKFSRSSGFLQTIQWMDSGCNLIETEEMLIKILKITIYKR